MTIENRKPPRGIEPRQVYKKTLSHITAKEKPCVPFLKHRAISASQIESYFVPRKNAETYARKAISNYIRA